MLWRNYDAFGQFVTGREYKMVIELLIQVGWCRTFGDGIDVLWIKDSTSILSLNLD